MKKTILYCITLSEMGGAQKQVFSLIKGCHMDYNIILACAPGGELIDWVRQLDQKIVIQELQHMKRNISPINDIKTFLFLISIIKRHKVDIVHCHSSKAGLLGRVAAWLMRVPVRMFTVHGWSVNEKQGPAVQKLFKSVERFTNCLSTHVICVSYADREKGLLWKLASSKKLITIQNGVSFKNQNPYLRELLGVNKDTFIVGTVARLSKQKNPLMSIDIFAKLLKKNDNLMFVWIGDGPLMEKCKSKIQQLGIDNRFILLGNREDTENLIKDFDLFSLLSDWESLPISIIEAMFAGLPIIATDVGGVKELVMHNRNGYVVNSLNIEDIEDKISFLINNKDILTKFGLESKRIACISFKEESMIEKYKEVYRQSLLKM